MLARHRHARRMDNVGPDTSGAQPAGEPETISASLLGDDHPADRPASRLGLNPPSRQEVLKRRRIRVQLLQRSPRDPRQCAGDQPARVTQFDYRDHCGLLVKGHK